MSVALFGFAQRSLEQDHWLFDLESSWDEWKKLVARAAICKVQLRAEVGGPEGTEYLSRYMRLAPSRSEEKLRNETHIVR